MYKIILNGGVLIMEKKLEEYLALNSYFDVNFDNGEKIKGEYSDKIYDLKHENFQNKYKFRYYIKEIKENKIYFFI